MSSRITRGGREGREVFLSAHRCPEVDVLPQHHCESQIHPPSSGVSAEKISEFTCVGTNEADYLDISSTCCNEEEEEEDGGSISDWSEEDLSLHFSPSVILQSDEESDPESGFECVDVAMETQMKGQEGEGLKMVPKRQIQLRKKDTDNVTDQEILKDGPAERGVLSKDLSANELLCSTACHRPDVLLRQHSMPASFHTHSTTGNDGDNYRVYRGLVTGASQGLLVGGNSRRLQKSLSLDETKTKMASCIIKNILSKKMQVEQTGSKTPQLKNKPEPVLAPAAEQQGGKPGVFKAPVHVVRDMRSVVKNTYSLSFTPTTTTSATTTTAKPENNRPTGIKMISQEDSPPPTYQQAVGVKSHVAKSGNHVRQSCNWKPVDVFTCPIIQQRQGSQPIISRDEGDDITGSVMPPSILPTGSNLSKLSQSESPVTSIPSAVFIQPPPPPLQGTQPHLSAQEQSSISQMSPHSVAVSSQQILYPCFNTLHSHPGKVSYIHNPQNNIHSQLQHPAASLHLLKSSKENHKKSAGNYSDQHAQTTGHQKGLSSSVRPTSQELHMQQVQKQQQLQLQSFLWNVQGFCPTQVGGDFLVDITGSAAAPAALLSVPVPSQLMLDHKSGRCFYVDMPPQPQRKTLLDPETGQFIQVLLPAARSTSNTTVLPVHSSNPTPATMIPPPAVFQVGSTKPTVLTVLPCQTPVAVSSLYSPTYLPITVITSLKQPSDDITPTAL
ncbi:uncharacterized protein LOC114446345 [Parambassis ranga]|uniref:Uncharacterized protein LOC114446345 n=1 Tax=Parambassis ranga TaxID=210632 RepID=A0A6P7JL61_9TELE|nr:uncharacterized protein LOC114446345 [Parambassis ranga]